MSPTRSLAVVAGLVVALLPALPGHAAHDVQTDRIAGQSRYGTAAEVAHARHPDGVSHAILASGEDHPDALAGAPLAAHVDAPVLLTQRDHVPDSTLSALDSLGVEHVTVLGGPSAVSEDVVDTVESSLPIEAERLEGDTRYATAAAVARRVHDGTDGAATFPDGRRAAFVVSGQGFADALAAGAPASGTDVPTPVLLTEQDQVPASTRTALEDLDVEHVVLVGGRQAISEEVARSLADDDTTVERVWGDTRTGTATAVADYAIANLGFDAANVELARGDDFADALAVGPLAGGRRNPVLLTRDGAHASEATTSWLGEACSDVRRIRAIGGEEALSPEAVDQAETAAEDCHGSEGPGLFGDGPT